MNLIPERAVFRRQIFVWALRGVFCAAPSFAWALLMGVTHGSQFVAMATGVATYVLFFAWVTSLPSYLSTVETGALGWSLRFAANLRAALAPLAYYGPDLVLGMLAMRWVQFFSGATHNSQAMQNKNFIFIYFVTVVQGALVSLTLLLLAFFVWFLRRWWLRRRNRNGIAVLKRDADFGPDDTS